MSEVLARLRGFLPAAEVTDSSSLAIVLRFFWALFILWYSLSRSFFAFAADSSRCLTGGTTTVVGLYSSCVAVDSSPSPMSSSDWQHRLEIRHIKQILNNAHPLVCRTTRRKHPITVRDLKLSATDALILEIVLKTGDDISTAVCRGLRQI